jgi:hypothetical protein
VAISESRIDVSWRDNSRNEAGFEVYRSEHGPQGLFSLVAKAGAGATSLGNPALNPSTQYCYKVRALTTAGGRTRYSDFSKPACATTKAPPAQPGIIQITTVTSGFDFDVDGYLVRVDGGPEQPVGTNATVTVTGVPAGDHAVSIGDVASNCSVEGANPRAVSVAGGATTEVAFSVVCASGPTIELSTVTTGANIDADGYGVLLWRLSMGSRTFALSVVVPANVSVKFSGLTIGQYELEVNGIAPNCSLTDLLYPVDLTFGGTVSVVVNLVCAPLQYPPGVEICDNGVDDDGDGLVDSLDPDCTGWPGCQWGACGFDHCAPGFICGYDGCCVSHCWDGQWNGTEGDVDCGGDCINKCQRGQHCWSNFDCASGSCSFDVCQ